MYSYTLKIIASISMIFYGIIVNAQNLEWVASMGGNIEDDGSIVMVDDSGNVYSAGFFKDTVDFDPGPGISNLNSNGAYDIYIQKLDPNGNFIWAKSIGGSGDDKVFSIAIDGMGNIYTTGWYGATVDFDPNAGVHNLTALSPGDIYILKLDSNGNFVWVKSMGNTGPDVGYSLTLDNSGNLYTTGIFTGTVDFDPGPSTTNLTSGGFIDIFIQKLDTSGNFIWAKSMGGPNEDWGWSIAVDNSNNVYTTGYFNGTVDFDPGPGVTNLTSPGNDDIYVQKLDANGNLLWVKSVGGTSHDRSRSLALDNLGNVYITGDFQGTVDFDPGPSTTNLTSVGFLDIFVLKLDQNGNFAWANNIGSSSADQGHSIALDGSNNVYTTGYFRQTVDFDPGPGTTNLTAQGLVDAFIQKLDQNGNFIWAGKFGGNGDNIGYGIFADATDNIYLTGYYEDSADFDPNQGISTSIAKGARDIFVVKLSPYQNSIAGNIYNDQNFNCIGDSAESGLQSIIVEAIGSLTFYGSTDSLGNYAFLVDTGTYSISPILPSSYWQSCNPSQVIVANNSTSSNIVDFGLQPIINCPLMQVDLQAPFLRRSDSSVYYINYCNNGTVDALNAYIDIELDSFLNVLSTGLPIANQNGTIYTFNLGNVPINHCNSFYIEVFVDSTAILSQTHCSEAHIYPDSICLPPWTSFILDVEATCLNNDSVLFTIKNIGSAPTSFERYFVFEDDVIFKIDSINPLAISATEIVPIAANAGSTYRLEIAQAPSYPSILGDSVTSAAIEGCKPLGNGNFNTGFITQFSNGNSAPFIAVDCQQNIGSWDPNDKSAQPEGYQGAHYIYGNTALDYKIRFQNTGTDTAFRVVVIDTISPFLDPTSIEMGASTHSYSWQLSGQGILTVTFDPIALPDSNANLVESNGSFRFRIQQKAGNPIGTVINNQAAIYFDNNPAVLTNTTFHSIGDNFASIHLKVGEILENNTEVKVYPNPFTHSTTIAIQDKEYEELSLRVYDLTGRELRQEKSYFNNQIQLFKGDLHTGVYLYQLIGDGQLINTGKIIVQQ